MGKLLSPTNFEESTFRSIFFRNRSGIPSNYLCLDFFVVYENICNKVLVTQDGTFHCTEGELRGKSSGGRITQTCLKVKLKNKHKTEGNASKRDRLALWTDCLELAIQVGMMW